MPVYAKKVETTDKRLFGGRNCTITTGRGLGGTVDVIPVPNNVVLCNGCNSNIHETKEQEGYLVYLGKRELQQDNPYDIYCESCLNKYFPKYQVVD